MVVEDPARDGQKLGNLRIPKRIADRQSLLPGTDDAVIAQDGQLLRRDRLVHAQCLLQLLDGATAAGQDLQDSDSHRMRERTKKIGFERLEFLCGV